MTSPADDQAAEEGGRPDAVAVGDSQHRDHVPRPVSSPADDLRAFTVEWNDQAVLDWVEAHGVAVLALLDAAQAVDDLAESSLYRVRAYDRPGRQFHDLHMALHGLLAEPRP